MRAPALLMAISLAACAGMTAGQVITAVTADVCEVDALSGALVPSGTPAAVIVADIQFACPEAKQVEAFVAAFLAEQADAGTAPDVPSYVPSLLVARAKIKAHR